MLKKIGNCLVANVGYNFEVASLRNILLNNLISPNKKVVLLVTAKLLSAKVKNTQVDCFANSYKIPSKKAKFVERFCKKWQNNPHNNLAIIHFCTQ